MEEKYYDRQMINYNCPNANFSWPLEVSYRRNWISVAVVNLILAPVTFFMNFVILFALSKLKDRNTITNYLFRSLCITDMLTGLLAQPLFGALYLNVFSKKASCSLLVATVGSGYFFVTISFFTLLGIHIERYLGVFHPLYHSKIKTKTTLIKKIIVTGWVLTAIYVLLCFVTPYLILFTVSYAVFVPVSFTWCCYVQVKIVREVYRINKRGRNNIVPETNEIKTERERHFNRVQSRANRITGLILVAYTVCYIPGIIACILLQIDKDSHILLAVVRWGETLALLNSLCNPLLFTLQKKDVRQIIFYFFCSLKPCSTAK